MSNLSFIPCLFVALLVRWFFLPEARAVSSTRAMMFGLTQAASSLLFFSPSFEVLPIALGHGVICAVTLGFTERRQLEAPGSRLLLLFAHFAATILCLKFAAPLEWFARSWGMRTTPVLPVVWLTGALLCLKESNFFIRWFFTRIRENAERPVANQEQKVRAETGNGRVIGSLERLLIYVLILAGQPIAVPVVVAVKGLARFKRMEEDQAFAEYVIIGTFLSVLLTLAAIGFVRAVG